ncbi:MAG: hypothetical protein D6681_20270 [Calditrichaeota bacterium]|nr:MAG: hypothetical protein D6681_20270 [Calditrichota bacterium]
MADTIVGTIESAFQETLGPTIMQMRLEADPFFQRIFIDGKSAEPVTGRLGRNWQVRDIIETGGAGAVEYDDILGNNALTDDNPASGLADNFIVYGENAPSTWPGLNETVAPGYIPISFQLKNFKGNAHIPLNLIRSQSLPSVVAKPVDATIRGLARTVTQALANQFWKEQATDGSDTLNYIATLALSSGDTIESGGIKSGGSYTTVSLTGGSIRRLYEGLRVDLYRATGSGFTRVNAVDQPVFVSQLDPLGDKITLKVKHGSSISIGGSWTLYLVPRKSNPSGTANKNTGASGLIDYIKSSGTLGVAINSDYGALSLTRFPMLRSAVVSNSNAALTETGLLQKLARIRFALGNLWDVDTLVARPGVWIAYFEQITGGTGTIYRRNMQSGQPVNISGGLSNDMMLDYDGQTYQFVSSPLCHANTVWMLKTRDRNWRMYVAPRLRDSETMEILNDYVEFLGPAMGYNSIMIPVSNPTAPVASPTNFRQIPFEFPHEFVPKIIPGGKITDVQDTMAAAM